MQQNTTATVWSANVNVKNRTLRFALLCLGALIVTLLAVRPAFAQGEEPLPAPALPARTPKLHHFSCSTMAASGSLALKDRPVI